MLKVESEPCSRCFFCTVLVPFPFCWQYRSAAGSVEQKATIEMREAAVGSMRGRFVFFYWIGGPRCFQYTLLPCMLVPYLLFVVAICFCGESDELQLRSFFLLLLPILDWLIHSDWRSGNLACLWFRATPNFSFKAITVMMMMMTQRRKPFSLNLNIL